MRLSSPQSIAETPQAAPAPGASPISLAPVNQGAPEPGSAISDAPPENPRAAPAKEGAGSHHHTVAHGDTLFSLAQKFYGNRSKWRDIYAANRDVLSSEKTPLKIGTDLKIP